MAIDKRTETSTSNPRGNVNGMNLTNPTVNRVSVPQQSQKVTMVPNRATQARGKSS